MKQINSNSRNGVIALNILFAGILAAVTFAPVGEAVTVAQNRYIAVPGTVNGLQTGTVYIADTTGQELIAITYDSNLNKIKELGYRNLASDAQTVPN